MNVQRYKVGYYSDEWGMSSNTPCLLKDDNGYAVKFEDYEQLRQRVAELEENWRLSEVASAKRQMNVIKLTAERDALKQQRDGLLKACETYMSHGICDVTYYTIRNAIASVKEKQNAADR